MSVDRARLEATLGRPELSRLVQRLRTRLERGTALTGTLAIPDATAAERDALNRLLGRTSVRGNTVAVPLDTLEEKLRGAGICPDLRSAVELLIGPIVNKRAEQEASLRQWEDLFAAALRRIGRRPELENWLAQLWATGALRRYGIREAGPLLSQALEVLAALPAADVPLAELAAATLGDAHALDPDTSLGIVVLRAVAALGKSAKFDDAQSRRETWANVGVVCDELSAPVLVLNLRASGDAASAQVLRTQASVGEPTFITVRQLLRPELGFSSEQAGPIVYVCENPSVMAAAARRLGALSQPLVCIEGQPRTATRLLLNRLRAAGIQLAYHGDFDWPGIQIANTIISRHSAAAWRMAAGDYLSAAAGPLKLSGTPVVASWDDKLMPAMLHTARAVHEEQVTELLLADLAAHSIR